MKVEGHGKNGHFLALVYYYIMTQCYLLGPLAKNVISCVLVGIVCEPRFLTLPNTKARIVHYSA